MLLVGFYKLHSYYPSRQNRIVLLITIHLYYSTICDKSNHLITILVKLDQ